MLYGDLCGWCWQEKVGGLWYKFMEGIQVFMVQKVLKVVYLPGDGLSQFTNGFVVLFPV